MLVLVLLVLPSLAHADPDPVRTKAAMEDYFAGEKTGGLTLVGMGVGGLVAGGLLFRSSNLTAKGMSYPLLTVGLLHVAAGVFVYTASNKRIDDFGAKIENDPQAFVTDERKRMAGVSTQFTVLKIVEVVLIAGGLAMAGIGHKTDRPRLKGAGLAIALEIGLTLGFDFVAARRAHGYRAELAAIDVQAGIDPLTGAPTAMLVRTFTF